MTIIISTTCPSKSLPPSAIEESVLRQIRETQAGIADVAEWEQIDSRCIRWPQSKPNISFHSLPIYPRRISLFVPPAASWNMPNWPSVLCCFHIVFQTSLHFASACSLFPHFHSTVPFGKLGVIAPKERITKTMTPRHATRRSVRRGWLLKSNAWMASVFVAAALSVAHATGAPFAYVTNTGDNTVSVIDMAANAVIAVIPVGNGPVGTALTPDGTHEYVLNFGAGTVSVIDTSTNTVVATISGEKNPVGISITPDGTRAYVTNASNSTVAVIATATNTVDASIAVGSIPVGISISPDGGRAYVTNLGDGTVSVISTGTNTVVASIPLGAFGPATVAITPDMTHAYVTDSVSGMVSVIATATNTVMTTIRVGNSPTGIAFTPDGAYAYVTNLGDNAVSVIATATNTVVGSPIPVGPFVRFFGGGGIAVNSDGSRVYVANGAGNTVSVIATATNTVVATIPVGKFPTQVAISSPFTGPAPSSGTTCNGTYNGIFNGNLTVSAGQKCTFVNGGVTGNVQQNGGSLTLIQTQVGGNVQVTGGGTFSISQGSIINGNLQVQSLPGVSGQNQVCGTTVKGDLQFQNNGGAMLIGSTNASSCAGDKIGGNLDVHDNSAATTVVGNSVTGNLDAHNNTGSMQVFNNVVGMNLQCQNNSSITGGGNTATSKQGQCSTF